MPLIVNQIGRFNASTLGQFRDLKPWELTAVLTPGTIVGRLSLVDQAPVDIA